MLKDKMEHCIVFMNSWDVSDVFWSFSKCNITIPHFSTVPSREMKQVKILKLFSYHSHFHLSIARIQYTVVCTAFQTEHSKDPKTKHETQTAYN